jgi:hypothetical protein
MILLYFQVRSFPFSQSEEKNVVIKMYEEVASQAAGLLVLVFLVIVASIIIGGWMIFRRKSG